MNPLTSQIYLKTRLLPVFHDTLSDSDFRLVYRYLPTYMRRFTLGSSRYSVYKAKDAGKAGWNDLILKRLVTECRKTYKLFYNDSIPELDGDDKEADVYLVHVRFPFQAEKDKKIVVEKWYSVRFVYAADAPSIHAVDLALYAYKSLGGDLSLFELLREKIPEFSSLPTEELKTHIVMMSRFCSSKPYASLQSQQELYSKYFSAIKKKSEGGISLALMNWMFLEDVEKSDHQINLLTAQMHVSLSHDVLSYPPYTRKTRLPLDFAYKTLGVKNSELRLNRQKYSNYVYSYPGYFLDIIDLVRVLKYLVRIKKLSRGTIEKYLAVSFAEVTKQPKMYHFSRFEELLLVKGVIPGESMSGEELREYLNTHVKDGPSLRLIRIKTWKQGIQNFLKTVKQSSYV